MFRALLAGLLVSSAIAAPAGPTCKCVCIIQPDMIEPWLNSRQIPSDSCWPSASTWAALNATVGGKLIVTTPVAAPCYQGPQYNAATCANVVANWADAAFQANYPIGYSYPPTQSCDIPGGNTTTCSIGDSPVYAIKATSQDDVIAGVKFASRNNIRLVVKMTGHDLIAR